MSSTFTFRGVFACLAAGALLAAPAAWGARAYISVGAGDVTGIHYQAGGGLCSLVNAGRAEHQIYCLVSGSPGSAGNINALRRGERQLGFAQADLVQQAHDGDGAFADDGPFEGLRTVFAVHAETVTVVARDPDIRSIQHLRGKRVNLGHPAFGQRASLQALMDALGWTPDDFASLARLPAGPQQVAALCDGDIDAGIFIAGHPDQNVREALQCGGRIVPVSGPAIDRMIRKTPYYIEGAIPADLYDGLDDDVSTYGVTSLLIASSETPPELVHEVTRAVLEGVDELRGWHRAFADLDPATMARDLETTTAPVHAGAAMYYENNDLP